MTVEEIANPIEDPIEDPIENDASATAHRATTRPNVVKRLYDWVLHWAETPYGAPALFLLAFAESSFFPIPPDVLLIALALAIPTRSLRFALICTAGSVIGGAAGYGIGMFASDFGKSVIAWFGANYLQTAEDAFAKYGEWAVATAGLTPIPYKVFTIASGIFHQQIAFPMFMLASLLSRGARFYLIALLIRAYGEPIKGFIDRYFNWLALAFMVLLIGGFVVIKAFL